MLNGNKQDQQRSIEDKPKSAYWMSRQAAINYNKQVSCPSLDSELNKIFCDLVSSLLPKGSRILDIGAGTGAVSLEIASIGYVVSATDISEEMLSFLKKANPNIITYAGDIFNLKLKQKFDCVVSRWFVPHFRDWPQLIKHISDNFVAKGGLIVFDMPNKAHINLALEGPFTISKENFGYDHDPSSSNYYFYAAATDAEIKEVAAISGLKFIDRLPHGLFKANMILANRLGDEEFNYYKKLLAQVGDSEIGREFLHVVEKHITPMLRADLMHGSVVILKKA